jgi:tripartite ATP-independent transporter DctM subunit
VGGPSLVVVAIVVVTLAGGVWIGFALTAVGVLSLELFRTMPVTKFLAQDFWTTMTSPELIALPLFILMGEILHHTRLSEHLFRGMAPWTSRLPGGLVHVNVLACTLFAAASGSSAATTATVGRITLRELATRGYDRDVSLGSLSGAGTLGIMIPPSIPMIVYGVLTSVSILQLFTAGIVPGLLLAAGFIVYIGARALVRGERTPGTDRGYTWRDRFSGLVYLMPTVLLVALVIGSMYGGFAGPSEAAAVGVFGALLIAAAQRTLTLPMLHAGALATVRTCGMLGLILAGALFLSKAMTLLGLPKLVAIAIGELGLGPYGLVAVLLVFYVVLGMFLDGLSIIVMTVPITFPLVTGAGFDPIWFGIFLVIVIEMSAITPPVGFNLFVIQSMTAEPVGRIARASLPFFVIMVALVAFLTAYPGAVHLLARNVRA